MRRFVFALTAITLLGPFGCHCSSDPAGNGDHLPPVPAVVPKTPTPYAPAVPPPGAPVIPGGPLGHPLLP
jgi:hypothetical protein